MAAVRETLTFVYNRPFLDAMLKAFTTIPTAKLIATPTLRLCTGAMPLITADTTLAALVALETNFSGYAPATPTLTDPTRLSQGAEGAIATATWVATSASPFVPGDITGYFLTDGTVLVGAEAFPAGQDVQIAFVGDWLTLQLVLPAQANQASS